MSPATAIERAFEMAKSGQFRTVAALTKALSKEGHAGAELYLSGPAIRKQLRTLIAKNALGDDL